MRLDALHHLPCGDRQKGQFLSSLVPHYWEESLRGLWTDGKRPFPSGLLVPPGPSRPHLQLPGNIHSPAFVEFPFLTVPPPPWPDKARCCHMGSSRYSSWAEDFACDLQKLGLKQAPAPPLRHPAHPTLSDRQPFLRGAPQGLCSPSPYPPKSPERARAAVKRLPISRQSLGISG